MKAIDILNNINAYVYVTEIQEQIDELATELRALENRSCESCKFVKTDDFDNIVSRLSTKSFKILQQMGVKMKLQVGNYYLSAGGEIIEIEFFNGAMFEDINLNTYFENGKCDGDCRDFDLIAEIPKSLHQYLIQTIKDYHTDSDFKLTIDSVYQCS